MSFVLDNQFFFNRLLNRNHKNSKFRFVVCINNSEYPASLELFKIYRALPDPDAESDGDFRVIDESGEDYLFPADYFIPIEAPFALKQAMVKEFAYNFPADCFGRQTGFSLTLASTYTVISCGAAPPRGPFRKATLNNITPKAEKPVHPTRSAKILFRLLVSANFSKEFSDFLITALVS